MTLYDWPDESHEEEGDRGGGRAFFAERVWSNVTAELLAGAQASLYGALAKLADDGISEVELDRQRWLPIGPSVLFRGDVSDGNIVTGRVRDVKLSPDGARIYAASANGGVWFSGDKGRNWSPLGGMATTPDHDALGRSANSLVIGCLHVVFGGNADADVVYAGTGEPSMYFYGDRDVAAAPVSKNAGIGVLKLKVPMSQAVANPNSNPWEREAKNLTGFGIYRIASDPQSEHLVAATTSGLFHRVGPFVRDANWHQVSIAPFDFQISDNVYITDVAWLPPATAPAAAPSRLFVALANLGETSKESSVYVSEAGLSGPFEKITLPDYLPKTRLALAPVYPKTATPGAHKRIVYVLGGEAKTPRLWRIEDKTAYRVTHLPPSLFGESNDQSWYDMAIAADFNDDRRVFVGGKSVGDDAALFRFGVSGSASSNDFSTNFKLENKNKPRHDATFVGQDVHADVHGIWASEDSQTVIVGCDGGVYYSDDSGKAYSFKQRNAGLAVTQSDYVACVDSFAGRVVSGLQDNGVISRIGDTAWQVTLGGDGGGVCIHPGDRRAAYLFGQQADALWRSNDGNYTPPVERLQMDAKTGQMIIKESRYEFENHRALFYSGATIVQGASPGKARLVIGTFRPWLTEDWDPGSVTPMTWRTLPSGTDPFGGAAPDEHVDEIKEQAGSIVATKWLDAGTLSGNTFQNSKILVLYERAVVLLFQKPGTSDWDRAILTGDERRSRAITENDKIPDNAGSIDRLPWIGAWSDIAPHHAKKLGDNSFRGSFYVSTTGYSELTSAGFKEALRMDTLWWFDGHDKFYPTGLRNKGNKAPAFAVLCDPETPDVVFVGTAMGVWRGEFSQAGAAAPNWDWKMLSVGLPEAVVQDLAFHWNPSAPNGGLKLLRAATVSRGVWEVDLSANPASIGRAYLRVHALDERRVFPTSLIDFNQNLFAIPKLFPRLLSPDIAILNTLDAGVSPSEADFASVTSKEFDVGTTAATFRVQKLSPREHKAFVLAHYRHTTPMPASNVKIILLKRKLSPAEGDGSGIALSAAWKTAVFKLIDSEQNATLDDHWKLSSASDATDPVSNPTTASAAIRHVSATIDARMPRAAEFKLDLAKAKYGARYLLLAVMTSTKDPLKQAELAVANVADLVLNSRHACARAIMVKPLNYLFDHVLLEHYDQTTKAVVPGVVTATTDELKNNFYDAMKLGTVTNTTLQGKLDQIVADSKYKDILDDIALAIVDLSGAKKFVPEYAGYKDRKNFVAASSGKMPGMLAVYQLMADANNFLATELPAITSFKDLMSALWQQWQDAGVPRRYFPKLEDTYDWQAGAPPTLKIKKALIDRFNDFSFNHQAGPTPILLMNYPFIASTILSYGLFSPVDRTGLWVSNSYMVNEDAKTAAEKYRLSYLGKSMTSSPWPSNENPFSDVYTHCVSAVAIAQFMTLAAQGRMIDRQSSKNILDHIKFEQKHGGCMSGTAAPEAEILLGSGEVFAKCGFVDDVSHDPIFFTNSSGARAFVAVILTKRNKQAFSGDLLKSLADLVP